MRPDFEMQTTRTHRHITLNIIQDIICISYHILKFEYHVAGSLRPGTISKIIVYIVDPMITGTMYTQKIRYGHLLIGCERCSASQYKCICSGFRRFPKWRSKVTDYFCLNFVGLIYFHWRILATHRRSQKSLFCSAWMMHMCQLLQRSQQSASNCILHRPDFPNWHKNTMHCCQK